MLIRELAEKVVAEVRKLLTEDIIVVDTTGIIIASTDPKRIDTFHEGALIACRQKDKIIIAKKDEAILQGVKAGINLPVFFQGDVIGVIGITGNPDTVSPYGEIIRKMTELLISESYYTEQLDWQSRTMEAFLFDWIQLRDWDSTFINRAKLLNINLELNRRIMIAEFKHESFHLHREAWASVFTWNELGKDDLIVRWGNNRIICIIANAEHQSKTYFNERVIRFHHYLTEQLGLPITIGVGAVVNSVKLYESYQQAERAIKSSTTNNRIVYDEDLRLEMILEEIKRETKNDFIQRTIGNLLEDKDLEYTLRTLLDENFSLKNTADVLHVHINTLHYRLKKISELTNLNPRHLDDLFLIYLAFVLLDKHTK